MWCERVRYGRLLLFHGARGSPYELCVAFHWYCGRRVYAQRPLLIVNSVSVLALPKTSSVKSTESYTMSGLPASCTNSPSIV